MAATTSPVFACSRPPTWLRSRAKAAASQAGPPGLGDQRVERRRRRRRRAPRRRSRAARPPARAAARWSGRPGRRGSARGRSSSSSLRVPAAIAACWAAGVSSTRTPARLALVDERRIAAHGLPGAGQRDGARQLADRPRRQAVRLEPARGARQLLAQSRPRPLAERRSGRCPRPRPRRARPRPGRSSAGGAAAARGRSRRRVTRTPRSRPSSAATASAKRPLRGFSAACTSAATSGTGTSRRRASLGSERISAITSSSRNAGTSQSKPASRSCGSTFSGTCTVTPSCSAPGSKR